MNDTFSKLQHNEPLNVLQLFVNKKIREEINA